jgi:hypothetical protein
MKKLLLLLMTVVLYLLHQDWWNWNKIEPLFLGFLPIGLTYHAAFSLAAALMMWVMVRFAWPAELEEMESEEPEPPSPPAP